jgi:hypothetical protein
MTARLVAIGDSLTQGFQHGAIRRTEWSVPAIVARAIGAAPFRQADFTASGGGGPMLDLELASRLLDEHLGPEIEAWELPMALEHLRRFMDQVEDHWERGAGTKPSTTGPHHNLAVWGFEAVDALTITDGICRRNAPTPSDDWLFQLPESGMNRTAQRVLNPGRLRAREELSALDAASGIAEDEGIENLLVALGANNALGTCLFLELRWSSSTDRRRLAHQRQSTIWDPDHFAAVFDELADRVAALDADRTFLATIPHVTVAPVCRGVSPRARAEGGSALVDGYFEYYTHFWIWDSEFDPESHSRLTREDARIVDATIDAYNEHIRDLAAQRGWAVVDWCGLLDTLAFRRRDGVPRYRFPEGLLTALADNPATAFRLRPDGTVLLDTRFFRIPAAPVPDHAPTERWRQSYKGGLFGLDGVHPTTIGYGLVAHETLDVMAKAGVPGADPDALDWDAIVAADTLVTDPPRILAPLRQALGFLFGPAQLHHLIRHLSGLGSQPTP